MILLKRKNEKCQSKPSLRGEVAISVEECSRRTQRVDSDDGDESPVVMVIMVAMVMVNYDKIHSKLPIFCVITAKYTVNCQFFALNL